MLNGVDQEIQKSISKREKRERERERDIEHERATFSIVFQYFIYEPRVQRQGRMLQLGPLCDHQSSLHHPGLKLKSSHQKRYKNSQELEYLIISLGKLEVFAIFLLCFDCSPYGSRDEALFAQSMRHGSVLHCCLKALLAVSVHPF